MPSAISWMLVPVCVLVIMVRPFARWLEENRMWCEPAPRYSDFFYPLGYAEVHERPADLGRRRRRRAPGARDSVRLAGSCGGGGSCTLSPPGAPRAPVRTTPSARRARRGRPDAAGPGADDRTAAQRRAA